MLPSRTEVLVIGAGIAGLSAALRLAARGKAVTVLAKAPLQEASSFWAQGGIAAVSDPDDAVQSHVADTLDAGAGLSHLQAASVIAQRAPEMIGWLEDQGVTFTQDRAGRRHLTREGGHSRRRIVHAADATGWAVMEVLQRNAEQDPLIKIVDHHLAIDLIVAAHPDPRAAGALVLNQRTGVVEAVLAQHTILATGGASNVYLYSSNPSTSTGDGIAMAWRAGCRVANMEFVQFHPTCLHHPDASSFLISEAVRGEGGRLRLPNGRCFMAAYDSRAELAPRDIVARAIHREMVEGGLDHVFLDISHRSKAFITKHFPAIYKRCREYGFDMTREPLPVTPAAHYTCGGIVTRERGETDLDGLLAIGECAFTGLHGGNRLASNSLLEGLVFAELASQAVLASPVPQLDQRLAPSLAQTAPSAPTDPARRRLQQLMWARVGIERSSNGLATAGRELAELAATVDDWWRRGGLDPALIELRNMVEVAQLIVASATQRRESRGAHCNVDYPKAARRAQDTVLDNHPRRSEKAA